MAVCLVKGFLYLYQKYGRNNIIYIGAVILALCPLLISKISGLFDLNVFGFLGLSYICFRVLQVIIETYDGIIKEINVIQFLGFLLFFPTLSSGPIDRSRRYVEDDNKIYKRSEYVELLGIGIWKLVLGMFYKIACSGYLYKVLGDIFEDRNAPLYVLGYAYIYGLYLFFDFAGYSAMAIGTGYILGIRIPDNFNKPFLSIDIKDFWNRWHITLSTWFRDFIFTRLMLNFTRKKRFHNRLTRASIALILNMTLMGIWHGLEAHYIVYGLYHGLLLAITEIYQRKSAFYKKNREKKWYKIISWALTLNVVMFGFLIFSGHIAQVWQALLRKI